MRFETDANNGEHSLTLKNPQQLKNHVKGSKNHLDVPKPIPKQIFLGSATHLSNDQGPASSQVVHRTPHSPPPPSKRPCHRDVPNKQGQIQQGCSDEETCGVAPSTGGIDPKTLEMLSDIVATFPELQAITRTDCLDELAETGQLDRLCHWLHRQTRVFLGLSGTGAPTAAPTIHRAPPKFLLPSHIQLLKEYSHFGRPATKQFLYYASQGYGIEYLVKRANFGKDWVTDSGLTRQDVVHFLTIVRVVWSFTKNRHEQVEKLIGFGIYFTNLKPIMSHSDIRRLVYDSPNSFMQNLPYPQPIEITHPDGKEFGGAFAYVPVIESIASLCLLGHQCFDFVTENTEDRMEMAMKLSESDYVQAMLDPTADVHLMLMTWQDGYAPNKCKKERNKTWVKTATLVTIDKHAPFRSKWKTTFLVALGLEAGDKRWVESRFLEDLKKIDVKGGLELYDMHLKKFVKVRVSIVGALGDQPERRGFCGFATTHTHTYGKALGITGDWKAIHKHVPSCDSCLRALLHENKTIKDCQECLNWDVVRDSHLASFEKPKSYPTTDVNPGTHLSFKKVDCKDLKRACDKAHLNLLHRQWTATQAVTFLKTEGLNTAVTNGVCDHAINMACWNERDRFAPELKEQMRLERDARPSLYQKYVLPPFITSGLSLKIVIPVLMHLLFMGVAKAMLEEIESWLKKERLTKSFSRFNRGVLEAIGKLQVDWCKPQPFSKNDQGQGVGGTGWMAEDFLSFCRIMPWIYQTLDDLDSKEEVEFPQYDMNDINCWTKDMCLDWLKLHRLSIKGNVQVVKERVQFYHAREEGPPQIIHNKPTPHRTQTLIQCVLAMISRLMARTVSSDFIEEMHRYILIFLSCYHRWDEEFDVGVRGYKNEAFLPSWIRKSNMMDLTTLVEFVKRFGPLVQFWDGGWIAEKFITAMRPFTGRGNRVGAHMHATLNFLKTNALDLVVTLDEQEGMPAASGPMPFQFGPKCRYRQYGKLGEIQGSFLNRKPFSGFVTKDGNFGVCVQAKRTKRITPKQCILVRHLEYKLTKCSMAYHRWELLFDGEPKEMDENTIERCVMFLPILCADGFSRDNEDDGLYTVIAEDWKVLDKDQSFVHPAAEPWLGPEQ